MRRVPTSPTAAVSSMRPGELVEVKGTLRCEKPLTSELAGRPCAYYRTWIDRLYDEDDVPRTVERSETVASNVELVPFFVEDGTGRVMVTPNGADVDAQSVHSRFEAVPARGRRTLGGKGLRLDYSFGTRGYRFREEILPIDGPIYVLGAVTSDGGIGRPSDDAREAGFIISCRSEEALSSAHQGDRLVLWCGAGALAGGTLLIVIALVVGFTWV